MSVVLLIEVVTCGFAPLLTNGYSTSWIFRLFDNRWLFGYNTTVSYSCNIGYWFLPGIFQQTVTCSASGNWTSLDNCIGALIKLSE